MAGSLQAATDLEFFIDLDPATGQETVVVAEVKPVRRQARALPFLFRAQWRGLSA